MRKVIEFTSGGYPLLIDIGRIFMAEPATVAKGTKLYLFDNPHTHIIVDEPYAEVKELLMKD